MNNIKQKAIAKGLCLPYQAEWTDNENLVDRYIKGVTFCLERQFPSLKDMLPFDSELMESDVYNSKNIDLIITGDTYILNDCVGAVEIVDYNVSRLYTSLNTVLKVKAKDHSILYIDAYDNSNIQLSVESNAKVRISQYGNSVIQVLKGKVKITDKR